MTMKNCSKCVTIVNQRGLHARASAGFVKLASRFNAEVTVSCEGQSVPGGSIMGLLLLGAAIGSEIVIETTGCDAKIALDALVELVNNGFGETDD